MKKKEYRREEVYITILQFFKITEKEGKEMLKIKDFKLDESNKTVLLITKVEERETKTRKAYCCIEFSDGETIIEAKAWDSTKEGFTSKYPERTLVSATIYTKIYEGRMDYQLQNCSIPSEPVELRDFIISAPEEPEKMYQGLLFYLNDCREDTWGIVDLTKEILEENKEKLLFWGAAKAIHHNFYAGLLYHTFSMVQEAYVTQKANKILNKELLICGTILHDIGKLRELDTDEIGVSDYTTEGRLLGHIVLADEMILEKVFLAKQNGNPYPEEKVALLRHMILAHHGKAEWGSPVSPAIMEAFVLHQIDLMDSKLIQYKDAYNKLEAGEISERIFGLGSSVVRPSFYNK